MVLSSKTNANGSMGLELDDVPTVGQTEDDLEWMGIDSKNLR